MTKFELEVVGPPGKADALLQRLHASGNRHGFSVEGQSKATGALSGIDLIVATVGSVAAAAQLVWAIVEYRQHVGKTTEPGVELHIHLHHGAASLEIVEDDEATIAEVQRLVKSDADGAESEST